MAKATLVEIIQSELSDVAHQSRLVTRHLISFVYPKPKTQTTWKYHRRHRALDITASIFQVV